MQSDGRYAAPVLGIQLADRPNQANGGLTPVYHRNSTWKPDILERVGVKHPDSLCSAAVTKHRIDTCAFAQDFRRVVAARTADVVYRVRLLPLSGVFGIRL
jgi:hypothetical protein